VLPDSYIDPVNKQYGGMVIFFFSEDLSMIKKFDWIYSLLVQMSIFAISCALQQFATLLIARMFLKKSFVVDI